MNLTAPIFTDADKAREHLEATRWPHGPICPHCGVVDEATALKGQAHRAGLYQCNACREQFTITVGTVFERSKVPLNKWLLATYLMSSSKKGISAHQIGRTLGVTYKTAWFMCHRIREAMGDNGAPMGGEGKFVEADETYVGGKETNKHVSKRKPGQKGQGEARVRATLARGAYNQRHIRLAEAWLTQRAEDQSAKLSRESLLIAISAKNAAWAAAIAAMLAIPIAIIAIVISLQSL